MPSTQGGGGSKSFSTNAFAEQLNSASIDANNQEPDFKPSPCIAQPKPIRSLSISFRQSKQTSP